MNKTYLPFLRSPNSTRIGYNHQILDRTSFAKQNMISCNKKTSLINSSIWDRLYQTPTSSSNRHSHNYNENDVPRNDLDFRLRTCYNHSQETFASKARIVVQPITVYQLPKRWNSSQTINYSIKIVNENRKEHFNEAIKGQHIGSDHFSISKHGYSRVVAGAMSND